MMKNLTQVITLGVLIFLPSIMMSQSSPTIDNNWVLNTSLSDEFNGTSIDGNKWKIYNYDGCCSERPFISTFASIESSCLVLKADFIGSPIYSNLRTSGLETRYANYLYGYYEIRAKLPGYFDVINNRHSNRGFWTAFWTYYHVKDVNGCIIGHDEIDIVEPNGYQYNGEDDARTNEVGCWEYTGSCSNTKFGAKIIHDLPLLYTDFHKFAAECLPDRIIYYFDDVPINIVYGQDLYPTHFMKVVLGNQLQSENIFNNPSSDPLLSAHPTWPQNFTIDYFRFYQLNTNYCGTDATITNNTQLTSFQFGVRRNITIGNGSSTISLTTGTNITLRSTNEITINGDFTVPLGSELFLIPTPCAL